jgi:hypothetical protein
LSYLPGHRWNNCLCPGQESEHPGPNLTIGRNAPEIDAVEAQVRVKDAKGEVSQSFQIAPYNAGYEVPNATHEIFDPEITMLNSYWGSTYQQAVSYLTDVDSKYYIDNSPEFGVFGFEFVGNENTRDDNYITWVANGKPSWTMHAESIGPDPLTDVGQRLVSEEPMYLILNFGTYRMSHTQQARKTVLKSLSYIGLSNNFQSVTFNQLSKSRVSYNHAESTC